MHTQSYTIEITRWSIKRGLLRLWVVASAIWLVGVAFDGVSPWLLGAELGWSHEQLWARLRDIFWLPLPPVLAGKTGVYFWQPDGLWAASGLWSLWVWPHVKLAIAAPLGLLVSGLVLGVTVRWVCAGFKRLR
jgi:hypothetical protein